MVCRVSDAFIRFGTFQLPASREEGHLVGKLADYVIKHHYPHLEGVLWLQLCHLPMRVLLLAFGEIKWYGNNAVVGVQHTCVLWPVPQGG